MLLLGSILCCNAYGQSKQLQQKITINANNISIPAFINLIEKQANIYFSYNSQIFNPTKKISANYVEVNLEQILKETIGSQYQFIATHEHIIILKNEQDGIWIQGILLDSISHEPIENASIIEVNSMNGTNSDGKGTFSLQLRKTQAAYQIMIRHIGYQDTNIILHPNVSLQKPILLAPAYSTIDEIDIISFQNHWLTSKVLNNKLKINSLNLNQYFNRQPYQFSLLPGIGSKSIAKSQSINSFSFNLLGGYVKGVNGFELGTLFNIVQQDMQYCQFGGLFNMVGGHIKGVQIAGAYNFGAKNQQGVQFSGLFNIIKGNTNGLMIAGVMNSSRQLSGVQMAGLINNSKNKVKGVQMAGGINLAAQVEGWQTAGLANISKDVTTGAQIAGGMNISDSMNGVQIAGIINLNMQNAKGTQIAGAFNINRKKMEGVQIAGLFNRAGYVKGTQIGILNIADSTTGPNIGLINIVKYGKKTFALSTHEWQLLQLSYKSGAPHFYNVLQLGWHPVHHHKSFSFGYGLGWENQHKQDWKIAHELTANTIYIGNWNDQHLLLKYQLLLQKKISTHLSIFMGPSLNLYYHENDRLYEGFSTKLPFQSTGISLNKHFNGWIGISGGFNFL